MELWKDLADTELIRAVRQFTTDHVTPMADHLDQHDMYPVDLIKATAGAGWNTLTLAPAYGGAGRPLRDQVAVFEELSVGSAILGISLITIFQSQKIIERFGQESLKQEYLPSYGRGLTAAYALTEDKHGSDITHLDTKAYRTATGWCVNGEKAFITSGSAAELFVILAETSAGLSTFAVPRGNPGIRTYETSHATTFGLRNGPHVNLVADQVELPEDHLIGDEGRGLKQAMVTLASSRVLAAGISLGISRAAFEGALRYARDRQAFGQSVLGFQGIQWYFAELGAELDAVRLLVYQSANDIDAGLNIARSSSAAKLLASRLATKVASIAVQVCGAHGVRDSQPFGRYLRDAKAYEIAGGSSEVLKNTIAKALIASADEERA
jgi:alkylation response protein AidB-like acyl-CoA dehydrogenase